jgi:serine/threonine-protein kinase ATR
MAIFQTMIIIPELSESTLDSWHQFLSVLGPAELGPHVGPTSAAFVASWPSLNPRARHLASQILSNIILGLGTDLGEQLHEIADLSEIEDLKHIHNRIQELRSAWTPRQKLKRILAQCTSDNHTVSIASLTELKAFMLSEQRQLLVELASGDIFDPMIGEILEVLFSTACRDGDALQQLRLLAFECIGILGAVDPDRFEGTTDDSAAVILNNFTEENETMAFVVHLISSLLVGAFRSTSDMSYQTRLAYVIQELLKFCQFTPALVAVGNSGGPVPLKVRHRWNLLPKHVLDTVSPLLEGRYAIRPQMPHKTQTPVYPQQSTYRDWIQTWTIHLINRIAGETAQKIFSVFRSIVRYQDVVIAHHILPYLVLNVLISGEDEDVEAIRTEFLVVLGDQVDPTSGSFSDKRLLSAQAIPTFSHYYQKY